MQNAAGTRSTGCGGRSGARGISPPGTARQTDLLHARAIAPAGRNRPPLYLLYTRLQVAYVQRWSVVPCPLHAACGVCWASCHTGQAPSLTDLKLDHRCTLNMCWCSE